MFGVIGLAVLSGLGRSKLTLPGGWLHLSFRGHRPYRFRSDDGNCSELAPGLMFDDFLPIPDAESLPFYPLVLKPVVCAIGIDSQSQGLLSSWQTHARFLGTRMAQGLEIGALVVEPYKKTGLS